MGKCEEEGLLEFNPFDVSQVFNYTPQPELWDLQKKRDVYVFSMFMHKKLGRYRFQSPSMLRIQRIC